MILKEYEKYIIEFLTQGIPELGRRIAYIKENEVIPSDTDIIIYKSNFFNDEIYKTEKSLPQFPLQNLEGIPILFGNPKIERKNNKIFVYADLIASTFFLITRYEEILNNKRDKFGRFMGETSISVKAGFIDRPILDEYTRLLKRLAGLEDENYHTKICLTHDIDSPYTHFNLATAVKKSIGDIVRRRPITSYQYTNALGNPISDPKYIFDKLIAFDSVAKDNDVIYFAKSGGNISPYDDYVYIRDGAWKQLSEKLLNSGAEIGYHSSFEAAENPDIFKKELKLLEEVQKTKITKHRSHYLRSMEPESFRVLIEAGITDDYTMGYADVAGFRLGTARDVRWIDPKSKEVTPLILHPMIAMDGTLVSKNYMGLAKSEAINYLKKIVDASFYGNPSVIWHNHIMYDSPELEDIYKWLVSYLNK